MTYRVALGLTFFLAAGATSGCASVPKNAGFSEVNQAVGSRTGLRVQWYHGGPEEAQVMGAIQAMLQEELTADAAVQIALLSNRSLQAIFEELGIAQADLVQAGLLKNPGFSGHVRFPDKAVESTNTEFSVSQDFLDLLLRPLRKRLAAAQLEQARLRIGDAVLNLTAEVRYAYYALQGAEHTRAMLQKVVQAGEAAAELAERQHVAGNINALDLANEQAAFQQAKLELTHSEAEMLAARERLNRLMGLGNSPSWKISQTLPELPAAEPSVDELEALALAQRLDLAATRQEVEVIEQAGALARRGVIPAVLVGIDTERDPDRTRVTGPSFEAELPVFDRRQAAIARAEAQFRQSQQQVAALETQIRSEVRSARDRLQITRQMIERYRDELIPLREQIVVESQKHYNFMLIGVFQLLQAKREEINAYREYILAFRDYWMARTDLEKAMGSRLPVLESQPAHPQPKEQKQESLHEHHH